MADVENTLVNTTIMLGSILTELRGAEVAKNPPYGELKTSDRPPLIERIGSTDSSLQSLADSLCALTSELQEYI